MQEKDSSGAQHANRLGGVREREMNGCVDG